MHSALFKMIILGLVWLLLFIIIAAVLAAAFITFSVQSRPQNKLFLAGKISSKLPAGFYQGKVNLKTSWQGKVFQPEQGRGINRFSAGQQQTEKFPFKLSVGASLLDPKLQVIKIDYNLAENPWWIRPIVDEIVEIEQGHYLGKLNYRIVPGVVMALGYFDLSKP